MCFSKNDFHYVFWCTLLENICPYLHTSNCFYYQLQLFRIKTFYLGQPCWSFEIWRKVTMYKVYVLKKTNLCYRIPTQGSQVMLSPLRPQTNGKHQAGFFSLFPFPFSQFFSTCFFFSFICHPHPYSSTPLHPSYPYTSHTFWV